MAFARALFLLLLLTCVASFVLFAVTSQTRYKRFGLKVLMGTLLAAFAFFAVLIVERLF